MLCLTPSSDPDAVNMTIVLGLGLTNLNAFGLVPIECFLDESFYNKAGDHMSAV